MVRCVQLVMGPAGVGKSTYCAALQQHGVVSRQPVHVVNMDPAADALAYEPAADVRELITVDDVSDELALGPNGALVYCMEYVLEDVEWLEEVVTSFVDGDWVVLDMPGQVELYTHFECVRELIRLMERQMGARCCAVFLLDASFLVDASKFFAGALTAMSAMLQLGVPHLNVLSKMDLVRRRLPDQEVKDEEEPWMVVPGEEEREEAFEGALERFLVPDVPALVAELDAKMDARFRALNARVGALLEDYSLVQLVPFSATDEEAIADAMLQVGMLLQHDEEREVRPQPDWEGIA